MNKLGLYRFLLIDEYPCAGRTVFIMKDMSKGRVVGNCRPIAGHPLMWKHGHLSRQALLPNEQKGCRKNCRGTKDQLLLAKTILKNC